MDAKNIKNENNNKRISLIFSFLLAFFFLLNWIFRINVFEGSVLDLSWFYALDKMPKEGLKLGVDSFFTYGPLSHWFGLSFTNTFQPIPYYIIGFFVFFVFLYNYFILFNQSKNIGISVTIFILMFYSVGLINGPTDILFFILIQSFIIGYLFIKKSHTWKINLLLLAVIGILYKFSFGIIAFLIFLLSILLPLFESLFFKKDFKKNLLISIYFILAFTIGSISLFYLLTGSWDLLRYIYYSFEIVSVYSEIMIFSEYGILVYIFGVILSIYTLLLSFMAYSNKKNSWNFTVFIISISLSIFLLYKSGFVRADGGHIFTFFSIIFAVCTLLYSILLINSAIKNWIPNLIIFILPCLIPTLLIYINNHNLSSITPFNSFNTYKNNIRNIFYLNKINQCTENKKTNSLSKFKSENKTLSETLDNLCSNGETKRITFYPSEIIYSELNNSCKLQTSPSLQLYSIGPNTNLMMKETKFLSSEARPDIVIVGSETLDNRNSLSEFTNIFPVLLNNYDFVAYQNEFTVLKSRKKSKNKTINCLAEGKGDFLKVSLNNTKKSNFIWKLTKIFFKSPQTNINLLIYLNNNERIVKQYRGYVSQLQKGVYISSFPMNILLSEKFLTNSKITHADAVLQKDKNFWNLPIIPSSQKLDVEYCSIK